MELEQSIMAKHSRCVSLLKYIKIKIKIKTDSVQLNFSHPKLKGSIFPLEEKQTVDTCCPIYSEN